MRDYKKYAQDLRRIAQFQNCFECYEGERTEGSCSSRCTLSKAADAIEELLAKVESSENRHVVESEMIDEMYAENERLKNKVPTWISVEERLPEDRQDVLCLLENKVVRILKFSPVQTTWFPQGFSYEHNGMNIRQTGNNVTHWMFLPEPPKGVE